MILAGMSSLPGIMPSGAVGGSHRNTSACASVMLEISSACRRALSVLAQGSAGAAPRAAPGRSRRIRR